MSTAVTAVPLGKYARDARFQRCKRSRRRCERPPERADTPVWGKRVKRAVRSLLGVPARRVGRPRWLSHRSRGLGEALVAPGPLQEAGPGASGHGPRPPTARDHEGRAGCWGWGPPRAERCMLRIDVAADRANRSCAGASVSALTKARRDPRAGSCARAPRGRDRPGARAARDRARGRERSPTRRPRSTTRRPPAGRARVVAGDA